MNRTKEQVDSLADALYYLKKAIRSQLTRTGQHSDSHDKHSLGVITKAIIVFKIMEVYYVDRNRLWFI